MTFRPKSTNSAVLPDATATNCFGRRLGVAAQRGDVIFLRGDLGAGKTTLARAAILERLPTPEDVPSPTFTIVQEYEASPPIWHIDLYRLGDESELVEIGIEDAFATAICLIEGPERLGALSPARRLEIDITMRNGGGSFDGGRDCHWAAFGDGWEAMLNALKDATPDG